MAGMSLANSSDIMREMVLPAAREQLNNSTPTIAMIERNTERVDGDEVVVQLHVGRNTGIGMRKEGDTIPAPGSQSYKKMRVPMRTLVGRGSVTVHAMKAVRGGAALDGPPGVTEMERLTDDIARDTSRQYWGTSDGRLATCAANATATNTILLDTTTPKSQKRQFFIGMRVDIGTLDDPVEAASNRTITAVNTGATPSITVSGGAFPTTTSHYVFRQGNGGSGVNQREYTSIPSIVASTGSIYGIDPATYQYWASTYNTDGSNRTPTDAIFGAAIDEVDIASGSEVDAIFVGHGVKRAYAATLTALKRFTDASVDLKGGYKGLSVAAGNSDIVLIADRDVPDNKAYGIDFDHIFRAEWSDGLEYLDEDGAVWSRIPDQLGYEFVVFNISELYTDKRAAHFVIDKLSEA